LCDFLVAQTPLKSRLFKFKSHPHGIFDVWHLQKSHYGGLNRFRDEILLAGVHLVGFDFIKPPEKEITFRLKIDLFFFGCTSIKNA